MISNKDLYEIKIHFKKKNRKQREEMPPESKSTFFVIYSADEPKRRSVNCVASSRSDL